MWAITRDENIYPNPESFLPERFLEEDARSLRSDILFPTSYSFGFGKRMCPGRHLAEGLLFSHFAHILAVFNIDLPRREPPVGVNSRAHVKTNPFAW